ncbi:MAG: prepilin peptidase [Clostridia bacterium]
MIYIIHILISILSIFSCKYITSYCKVEKSKINIIIISNLITGLIILNLGISFYSYILIIISYALLIISIIDLICFEIPFKLNLIVLISSIIISFYDYSNILTHILGSVSTGGFFLLLYLITKGEGLGFGDVKLMFFAGLGLGFEKAIVAFIISFVAGAILHPVFMFFLKKGNKFAFGPYMSLGIITAYIFADEIISLYLSLFI